MFRRLLDRTPSGYRPGVTLEHVRRNLGLEALGGAFTTADGLRVEVAERVESQWLMHLVMTEFSVRAPASRQSALSLEMRHIGAWRRTGVACARLRGESGWAQRVRQALEQDAALRAALMPLDFKRLRVQAQGGQWCVTLEHMGASEVVNQVPAFRRYIRLDERQRPLLLAALTHLHRCVSTL
ncbi:DUF3156 family protein [Pseudomonas sp. RIT-To-2]|uniref:DUF3156 family protein n=1 Tax=Pseudomonas sp. RIT-To-2 TaxID=3462541 RepID=UPI0024136041